MSDTIFFTSANNETILGLICGNEADAKAALGSGFTVLDPSKSEGAGEKHIPCVKEDGSTVTVQIGSVLHPMTIEHNIGWIYLKTTQGGQLKYLEPEKEPIAVFSLASGEKAVAAYAYCNLHGFWKADI